MQAHRQPWVELVTFAASSALLVALVFALLFASASVAYGYMQSLAPMPGRSSHAMQTAPATTFTGVITDQHCNAKHRLKDKSPADCTRICVSRGSHYVLVDGDSVFTLKGDKLKFDQVAGRRVTVAGNRVGDTIHVASISE